jgi:inner membrane protein
VDSLTHALTAAVLAYVLGIPELMPFLVLGAVIIDADILLSRVSDSNPRLYLFTHGGMAHSIGGAVGMAVLAWAGITLATLAGMIVLPAPAGPVAFAAVLGGTFLHIGLDWLACPGIPLFAPVSDTKYTAGLLPGPSVLLATTSILFLLWMGLGVIGFSGMILPYVAIIGAFLAVRLAVFGIARPKVDGDGRAVPSANPFQWLMIGETPDAWTVRKYRIGRGMEEPAIFLKYRNTTAEAVAPYLAVPEFRRVRYHSYITTVAQEGAGLVVTDPLRKAGYIFYPPYFTEVRIPVEESGSSGAGGGDRGGKGKGEKG